MEYPVNSYEIWVVNLLITVFGFITKIINQGLPKEIKLLGTL